MRMALRIWRTEIGNSLKVEVRDVASSKYLSLRCGFQRGIRTRCEVAYDIFFLSTTINYARFPSMKRCHTWSGMSRLFLPPELNLRPVGLELSSATIFIGEVVR
jgi:hypothetical protein